jgi:NhaP-type Na+/H+ and K+/H+ antiporter
MTAGRWALLIVAAGLLIFSVARAIQGSAGLWFTAVAMCITILATLRSGLKERRRSPDSSEADADR